MDESSELLVEGRLTLVDQLNQNLPEVESAQLAKNRAESRGDVAAMRERLLQ